MNDSDTKPRTSNKLVLVADEDARTARLLARMLRDDGYNVELVLDGAAALARLTRSPLPDAVGKPLPPPGGNCKMCDAVSGGP